MSDKNPFEFSSYKSVMKHFLRGKGRRGALSRAAENLKCQRSYLSRVINSALHLTPDQGFLLARFWKFPLDEREYFQTLVEYERASDPSYREELWEKLNTQRKRHDSLSERIRRPVPADSSQALYFSSWHWSAIHFLTSIPRFQTPSAISERLALPISMVLSCLEQLKEWSFVRQLGQGWEYLGGEFHLPKDSPFVIQHHQNWRNRAVLDAQIQHKENIHYTNVQTLSRVDLPAVKELFLKFISDCNRILGPSSPEKAIAVTCDLFEV
jgi:uncharacterized protein (TIGR02147 family)